MDDGVRRDHGHAPKANTSTAIAHIGTRSSARHAKPARDNRGSNAVERYSVVADRVMYGSDRFMLSRAHDGRLFPFNVAAHIEATKTNREKLFADNARRCFNL